MTASDFLYGAMVGSVLVLAVEAATGWAARRKAKPIPPPQYDPADVAFKRSRWHSLPGNRLELADTGFYITLNPAKADRVYEGFTPEGRAITWGNDLAAMKRFLEGEARDRAEFDPPAGGWRV